MFELFHGVEPSLVALEDVIPGLDREDGLAVIGMGLGTSPDIGVEDIGGGVRGVIVLGEADPGHLVAEDVKATGIADETDKAIDPVVRGNADALGLAGALAVELDDLGGTETCSSDELLKVLAVDALLTGDFLFVGDGADADVAAFEVEKDLKEVVVKVLGTPFTR